MTRTVYRLTANDFAVLEAMLMRGRALADPITPMLERKLAESSVVAAGAVGPDLATLNSRVIFRVGGDPSDTRTLVQAEASAPVGSGLPVATWRGLCLLGMRAGQSALAERPDGPACPILLEYVAFQPEAARRTAQDRAAERRGHGLKLVYSAPADDWPLGGRGKIRQTEEDDPGPSAA
ncbi:regulator of nucleoside diphosphate kinase [Mesorhizobium sp. NFR06]|uniref:nucleoside-diphosphate kinase n=1 Tax=Mesorhizobium sp. NFR06 TaxID=1566290 RepID=UPI0008E8423D|nr:nucleoside-diphosphate kinase [Mesorhizobium sp. NFR06]SFO45521.1 regulator of nucleoside diphosphate kinase [Mesorhizobium sp. NFR06]